MMPTHQRRFRISVSPTRRLHTDPSGSDTDTSTGKRRYVIKQQVMPGSTSSVLTTPDMTQPTSIAGITNSLSPRAPRVQFGDDDSPRIEHQPEIEPKVHATPLNQ
ncbi:unnamed protein product [Anisakis simplex]|uniref:Uncharacterized protein n=1 Tax=Anisakis simplex TaxID=6269 RepID=A0A0M3K369_ANISI|nr:unnamed protein product [Anisakis simplex]